MASVKTLAVIPARFASTRFPGKMLAELAGKPLVWHAWNQARSASLVDEAVVAIDDERIAAALAPYDVPVVMTRADHLCGTDRIAEVVEARAVDLVVNVQGDEPLIAPTTIDRVVQALLDDPEVPMATARRLMTDPEAVLDANNVKVVCDERDRALYFSRHPIPYVRDAESVSTSSRHYWHHYGLYGYRRDFLLAYAAWEPTPLEMAEKLEQLRVLEHGYPIAVVEADYDCIGVDSPEDLARVKGMMEA
jgi:3-deoxy-manno-octulosonate cytidylyltransferase (CMP-KDO synthetase)